MIVNVFSATLQGPGTQLRLILLLCFTMFCSNGCNVPRHKTNRLQNCHDSFFHKLPRQTSQCLFFLWTCFCILELLPNLFFKDENQCYCFFQKNSLIYQLPPKLQESFPWSSKSKFYPIAHML